MFCVAQTKKTKKSKPELTVVPGSWVGDGCVFFPPKDLTTLSKDGTSRPGRNWTAKPAKILGQLDSYEAAESRLTELTGVTDSEDAGIGTRNKPPAKKVKFSSEVYELSEFPDAPNSLDVPASTSTPTVTCTLASSVASTDSLAVANALTATNTPTATSTPILRVSSKISDAPASPAKLVTAASALNQEGLIQRSAIPSKPSVVYLPPIEVPRCEPSTSSSQVVPSQFMMQNSAAPTVEYVPQLNDGSGLANSFRNNEGSDFSISGLISELISPDQRSTPRLPANETVGTEILITTPTGTFKFIQLEDGSLIPIVDSEKIIEKLDRNHSLLLHLCDFAANIDRFIMKKNTACDIADTMTDAENKLCADALKVESNQDLIDLEEKLKNETFEARLLKYTKTIFKLNGKREGHVFFKIFMRATLNPHVLSGYSWQGNSRVADNVSFKDAFPRFVVLVQNVVRSADYQYTKEDNEKCFQLFLRNKNEEIKRFNSGGTKRTAFSRKRKTSGDGENEPGDDQNEEEDEIEIEEKPQV